MQRYIMFARQFKPMVRVCVLPTGFVYSLSVSMHAVIMKQWIEF